MPSRSTSTHRTEPNRAKLADSQSGAEREADQVRQVRAGRGLVRVDMASRRRRSSAVRPRSGAVRCPLGNSMPSSSRTGLDATGLVEDSLLHYAGDDGADHAPGVGGVLELLGGDPVLLDDTTNASRWATSHSTNRGSPLRASCSPMRSTPTRAFSAVEDARDACWARQQRPLLDDDCWTQVRPSEVDPVA